MFRHRSFAVLALIALCAAIAAPAAFAVQCSCHYCGPGNLLAACDWPGYGQVYCVDYWEFQCAWGPGLLAPAADEPFAEPLAWLDTVADHDMADGVGEAPDAESELLTETAIDPSMTADDTLAMTERQ